MLTHQALGMQASPGRHSEVAEPWWVCVEGCNPRGLSLRSRGARGLWWPEERGESL